MKSKLKSKLPLMLAAGTLAVAMTGCGSMNPRSSDRAAADRPVAVDRTVTVERTTTVYPDSARGAVASSRTPAAVDPFAPGYAPFPASANESAGIMGHSLYCTQHYNQPGCQTADSMYGPRDRDSRYNRTTGSLNDSRY